jgi:hypothetical protein
VIGRIQLAPNQQHTPLFVVLTNPLARTRPGETRTNDEVVPIYHVPPVVALGQQFKEKNRAAFFSGDPVWEKALMFSTAREGLRKMYNIITI